MRPSSGRLAAVTIRELLDTKRATIWLERTACRGSSAWSFFYARMYGTPFFFSLYAGPLR